jgi:hypothetical protein
MPPRWLMIVASVAIGFHLLSLGFHALAASSGPWPMPPEGSGPMPPPEFARTLDNWTGPLYRQILVTLKGKNVDAATVQNWTGPLYLQAIKLTHNYHFPSNSTNMTGIYLEARLTDRDGNQVTIKLPEDDANFWVRQRQSLLASSLGEDRPYMPQGAPKVVPEGQKAPSVLVWDRPEGETKEWLREVEEQKLSRVMPTMRPNPVALLLANSYARYLCRQYGAEKVELVRYYQSRIPPLLMDEQQQPLPGFFSKQTSYFGELPR